RLRRLGRYDAPATPSVGSDSHRPGGVLLGGVVAFRRLPPSRGHPLQHLVVSPHALAKRQAGRLGGGLLVGPAFRSDGEGYGRFASSPVRDSRKAGPGMDRGDRKSTRLNSSHVSISYAV